MQRVCFLLKVKQDRLAEYKRRHAQVWPDMLNALSETGWRNYNLSQPRNSVPVGPLVIMIHMASVWVPFTSESKEAIADYDEIRKEMKLALMECGRKLGTYLRKRQKMQKEAARRDVFERYIGEIAKAINAINGADAKKLYDALLKEARKRTAIADAQLDDEGKTIKKDETEELKNDEGVVMVESRAAHLKDAQESNGTEASTPVPSDGDSDLIPLGKKSKKKKPKKEKDNELF